MVVSRSLLMKSFGEQLRGNAVALISLAVALAGLSYNTWRNERTEHNRNIRTAAFEIITKLDDLERVVYLAQYEPGNSGGNSKVGWTDVIVIDDLSKAMQMPVFAPELRTAWGQNFEDLGKSDEKAVGRIDDAIAKVREAAIAVLQSLR